MQFLSKYSLTVLILSTCISAHAENKKWEYLTKSINILSDSAMAKQFNQLGKKNWELVTCSASKAKLVCVFKRKM